MKEHTYTMKNEFLQFELLSKKKKHQFNIHDEVLTVESELNPYDIKEQKPDGKKGFLSPLHLVETLVKKTD